MCGVTDQLAMAFLISCFVVVFVCSNPQINFDPLQIQSMTKASKSQIRKHAYTLVTIIFFVTLIFFFLGFPYSEG